MGNSSIPTAEGSVRETAFNKPIGDVQPKNPQAYISSSAILSALVPVIVAFMLLLLTVWLIIPSDVCQVSAIRILL